jgi:hypothetical protein
VSGIAYGFGTYVAVGWITRSDRGEGPVDGTVWTSTDGLTWTTHSDAAFAELPFQAVAFSGATFYAFGPAPTSVWSSADGVAWQQIDLPESGGELGTFNAFSDAAVGKATAAANFVYAGGSALTEGGDISCDCVALWRSSDGVDWLRSTISDSELAMNTFAVLPGSAGFEVAVTHGGFIGQAVFSSVGWDDWGPADVTLAEGSGLLDATTDGQQIVLVGYGGDAYDQAIAWVTDGTTWTPVTIDDSSGAPAEDVTHGHDKFVAIGTLMGGDRVTAISWWSADGLTWTRGPDVSDLARPDILPEPGDDPFQYRTIGAGDPGVVLGQTVDDVLHVWFAPWEAFAPGT